MHMQTIPCLSCVESRRCRANFIREIQHKVSPVHTRKYEQHFQTAHKHIHKLCLCADAIEEKVVASSG